MEGPSYSGFGAYDSCTTTDFGTVLGQVIRCLPEHRCLSGKAVCLFSFYDTICTSKIGLRSQIEHLRAKMLLRGQVKRKKASNLDDKNASQNSQVTSHPKGNRVIICTHLTVKRHNVHHKF